MIKTITITYLGSELTEADRMESEVDYRIANYKNDMGLLYPF